MTASLTTRLTESISRPVISFGHRSVRLFTEVYRTFNMGIGMVLIASVDEAEKIEAFLAARGETVYEIGRVVKGNHDVTIKGGVFRG